jgi:large subunit ribosomal protein L10
MSQRKLRAEKLSMIADLRGKLEHSAFVVVADFKGLKVAELTELRGTLRDKRSRLSVVKNTLLARVAAELGYGDITPLLDGATAIVTGDGDAAEVARAVRDYAKPSGRPAIKGGFLNLKVLRAADVAAIAATPPRPVLLAQLVGTVAAPMTRLVGAMSQKVSSLLYVLKAVEQKKAG